MAAITAVIFDLDGTLLDTLADLAESANQLLIDFGCPDHPIEQYKYFVGDGARTLVDRILPEERRGNDELIDEMLIRFQEIYGERWNQLTEPYEGIVEMLDALVDLDVRMGVLSNKPDQFTQLCVSHYLGNWPFSPIYGVKEGIPKKPDPAGVERILSEWEISTREVLYVGDTSTDMRTARAAGLTAVGVTWGFRPVEELIEAGANLIIDHPSQLPDMI